jgi:hypothetical protein
MNTSAVSWQCCGECVELIVPLIIVLVQGSVLNVYLSHTSYILHCCMFAINVHNSYMK